MPCLLMNSISSAVCFNQRNFIGGIVISWKAHKIFSFATGSLLCFEHKPRQTPDRISDGSSLLPKLCSYFKVIIGLSVASLPSVFPHVLRGFSGKTFSPTMSGSFDVASISSWLNQQWMLLSFYTLLHDLCICFSLPIGIFFCVYSHSCPSHLRSE